MSTHSESVHSAANPANDAKNDSNDDLVFDDSEQEDEDNVFLAWLLSTLNKFKEEETKEPDAHDDESTLPEDKRQRL